LGHSEPEHLLDGQEGAGVLIGAKLPGAVPDRSTAADRGFTLIELMVTITLIGMLLVLGLPAFMGWIRNSQVRSVAEALQTGVRTAQAEAVRRNRQVVMAFTNAPPSPAASAPWAVAAGGKNWWLQTVPQFGESFDFIRGGAFSDIASDVTIAAAPGTTAICFNSSGRLVTNTSGTGVPGASCTAQVSTFDVTQTGADRNLRVIVQIGGQLRICDPHRPTLSDASPDGCP
jgi:type IV fimbrial biogenesis protein FimT